MPSVLFQMRLSEETQKDLTWAKKQYHALSKSAVFAHALHTLRAQIEEANKAAEEKTSSAEQNSTEEAFYQKTFGHIKRDYGSGKQMLNDLGSNRVYRILHELLDPLEKENPPYANYCIERLKQEYPELYEIWE